MMKRSAREDAGRDESVTPREPDGLSRRGLLGAAGLGAIGLGGAALALTGCSTGAVSKPGAAADRSESQKWLRFDGRDTYNNTAGEPFPLLGEFSRLHHLDVTYTDAVSDDSVYYNRIKGQLRLGKDIGADAVLLSEGMASRWLRLGYAQEIDHALIPNLDAIRPLFMEAEFDPTRKMSLPWRSGLTGIAWNTDEIPDGLASVTDLWDPVLRGRVGVMSRMQDTIGLIMLDMGVDISSAGWGDSEFFAAVESLRDQVASGQVASIKGNTYKDDLKSRKSVAAIARSGDILQINQEAGPHWGFAVPDKGGMLWTDHVVIPVGARHKANVEEFINFYFLPENAVNVAAQTNFISPVELDTVDGLSLDPEVIGNELIFPTAATFQMAKTFRALDHSEEQRYMIQYQGVLLGA
jgi:spermidine/putrescine transport system substrate-binding protein